jgi:hypothetical protein
MPRKPKPGPEIKRIELMSTGREYIPVPAAVDDWGQPIVSRIDTTPLAALEDAQDIQDRRNREKRRAQREKLASLGITKTGYAAPEKPKVEFKPFKRRI